MGEIRQLFEHNPTHAMSDLSLTAMPFVPRNSVPQQRVRGVAPPGPLGISAAGSSGAPPASFDILRPSAAPQPSPEWIQMASTIALANPWSSSSGGARAPMMNL